MRVSKEADMSTEEWRIEIHTTNWNGSQIISQRRSSIHSIN
jgi:hypothetical protein